MNEHGLPTDSDRRIVRRRRRIRRGLVAGYIHELSARHNKRPARSRYELATSKLIDRPEGG